MNQRKYHSKLKELALTAMAILMLNSCGTVDRKNSGEVFNTEMQKFSNWIEENTKFDPYNGKLILDLPEARRRYALALKKMRETLTARGSFRTSVRAGYHFAEDCAESNNKFDPRFPYPCGAYTRAFNEAGIDYQYRSGAWERFLSDGFVVDMRGAAQGNLNFGSYTVPVGFTAMTYFVDGTDGQVIWFSHKFNIKKNVEIKEKPSVGVKKSDSVTDKLRALKSLMEEGVITKEEFEEKKSEILKKL